jgi:hypothetical protein
MSDRARLEIKIEELISRLSRLELRVSELESNQFELVSAAAEVPASGASEHTAASAAAASEHRPVSAQSSSVPIFDYPSIAIDSVREDRLISIGQWISRALRNQITGLSGREKLPEPSQFYLVFRGVNGIVYNPVKVFATFEESCRFVKSRGGSLGRSVFIGVPSKADGRIICSAAGVSWPDC